MANRRSSRANSTSSSAPTIDPMTPVLSAVSESPSSGPTPSDSMSPFSKQTSRKRSTVKKRSMSKSRKRSIRKARTSSSERYSVTSLGILKAQDSVADFHLESTDVGTSISPKSLQAFHSFRSDSRQFRELPLPFDVFWLAFSTVLAFVYALAAIHPEHLDKFEISPLIKAIVPVGASWQVFARCSALFAIGSIPIRRWSANHAAETDIGSDLIVFSVFGVIKLALIQMFMFKSHESVYQAAMLHASLGFAVQEFVVNITSSPFTSSLQRLIEIMGNSMVLFIAEDDMSLKAMAYTLTTLTLAKVLRAFISIASSRESYRTFRKAVTIGHTALLSFGIPFIGNYLMTSGKAMNADDEPTYAHIFGPYICAGVLLSSIILSHIDYLFT